MNKFLDNNSADSPCCGDSTHITYGLNYCLTRSLDGTCLYPVCTLNESQVEQNQGGWRIGDRRETKLPPRPGKEPPYDLQLLYDTLLSKKGEGPEVLLVWAEALNQHDLWQDAQSVAAYILETNKNPVIELRAAQVGAVALEHLDDPRTEIARDLVANLQEIARITEELAADGPSILGVLWNAVPKLETPSRFDPDQIPAWDPLWSATEEATAQLGAMTQHISAAAQLKQQLMHNLGE